MGLLLGLALGGAAYAVLNPGGLEGRIPPIGLGAFESVRLGVGLAAGLLGAAVAIAAFAGPTERRRRRDDDRPPLADFQLDAPAEEPQAAAEPPEEPGRSERVALEASDPFPVEAAAPEPEPEPFPMTAETEPRAFEAAPEADAEAPCEPAPAPQVVPPAPLAAAAAAAPESPPPEAAPATAEPAPVADPETFSFDAARAALRSAARAEAWSEAADALRLVRRLAVDERQHMLAAQDAGDFARAQGLTDDAVEAYDEALAYARMAGSPGELADALINVGDMAYDEQRLDYAVANYEEAVGLRRRIAQDTPSPDARRSLSIALERLADAREDRGHRMRALDLYRESEAVTAELAQADAARFGADLAATRKRLEELEARVLA